jgi:hypothetical protein
MPKNARFKVGQIVGIYQDSPLDGKRGEIKEIKGREDVYFYRVQFEDGFSMFFQEDHLALVRDVRTMPKFQKNERVLVLVDWTPHQGESAVVEQINKLETGRIYYGVRFKNDTILVVPEEGLKKLDH